MTLVGFSKLMSAIFEQLRPFSFLRKMLIETVGYDWPLDRMKISIAPQFQSWVWKIFFFSFRNLNMCIVSCVRDLRLCSLLKLRNSFHMNIFSTVENVLLTVDEWVWKCLINPKSSREIGIFLISQIIWECWNSNVALWNSWTRMSLTVKHSRIRSNATLDWMNVRHESECMCVCALAHLNML